MTDLMKAVLLALLPPGAIWNVAQGKDLDLLLDGFSDILESQRTGINEQAFIRSPEFTSFLDDLERDYGLLPTDLLTEAERRARLLAAKTDKNSDGSSDFLQQKLRDAGFTDIYVHINNPPVDPDIFIFETFKASCGFGTSLCGHEDAIMAAIGGELVVNGEVFNFIRDYPVQFGQTTSLCGHEDAIMVLYNIKKEIIENIFEIPADSGYWGMFFFVGGVATRDVGGELLTIDSIEIPVARREEIRRLILKYKPLGTWCGLIATFI
jgi:hypothetical protein